MKYQSLKCIKCGKKAADRIMICSFCKGYYSLLFVDYKKKVSSFDQLYEYYLPFGLFKETDFTNCSLLKYTKNLWIKNEGENKSKSIKEKDIFAGLRVASYFKFKRASLVSSGSGISVFNFFAKKANLPITLYSPVSAKRLYSKDQVIAGDDYEDTFRQVLDNGDSNSFNITPGINPYSQEGAKVISWQLIDSGLDFDIIVVPCGNGSILWSIYKGFKEALENGRIDKIPALHSVELKNGPIRRALKTEKIEKNDFVLHSKASAIDVKESFCLQKAVIAIKKSGGKANYVSEKEIEQAYKKLHNSGFKTQFAAAAAFAAALKLSKKFSKKRVCCVITASE
ncbi:MAG: pyridoxal-phosphate dependent enzyme [Candidatus Levybacteria bacterium]|nr:pyridoxal-phosphate dependent enzyme [Candidatus Levybacteria bacterium]